MPQLPTQSAAALFERHGAMVYRRCLAILRDQDLARDAVQEVFARVVAQLGRFRGQASALTWIYSVATLYCLQQLRNNRRQAQKLVALGAEQEGAAEARLEDRITVAALLEQAEPELQQIVVLRLVDGMTAEEVAEVTGLSRKTVTRRLQGFISEARARLQRPDLGSEVCP
jgi:RNA polymerase sigma-70 factor (ECF subfamily)